MPKTTDVFALPSPDTHTDPFTPQEDIEALADAVDTILDMLVPVGSQIVTAASALPAGGRMDWADGALISTATYPRFLAAVGHAYNSGIDPGGGMVRKPDKRGRGSIGAIDMGTGAGANTNQRAQLARGAAGGEVNHQLSESELAAHSHPAAGGGSFVTYVGTGGAQNDGASGGTTALLFGTTNSAGSGVSHNNLSPYETDNVMVRIA